LLDTDARAQVDEGNWFSTGDVASIDPLGYMAITERRNGDGCTRAGG